LLARLGRGRASTGPTLPLVATFGVERGTWRGEVALVLRAGDTTAVFLPHLGMTGVSLRRSRREFLAVPGGPNALRAGHTGGLPLLAPWANRLGVGAPGRARSYRAAGVTVPVPRRGRLHRDGTGLPIHGLFVGRGDWQVTERAGPRTSGARGSGGGATFTAALDVDDPVFPFPHRLGLSVRLDQGRLRVTTTIVPTARRRVPVAFGWHPYLRVPVAPRSRWRLRLPAREHLLLDARGLPTGERVPVAAEAAPVGRRTFDDLFALGRIRVLGLEHDDGALTLRSDAGFPFAQVWVPPGRPFAALEPMTAATDALGTGTAPLVSPGDQFAATFTLTVE